jgi:outer membrane protein TolC
VLLAGIGALLAAMPANAADQPANRTMATVSATGHTLDELLGIARRMSPELAARALETEAAEARADAADKLPDPKLSVTYDQWPLASPGAAPSLTRLGFVKYMVVQEFPLGGKLDSKREQALAESRAVAIDRENAETELVARVKTVFAEYVQAGRAIERTQATLTILKSIADQVRLRYGQGVGTQVDAIQAEIERKDLESELVRLEYERRQAGIRINTLLNRSSEAPLPAGGGLRPLPPAPALDPVALTERARHTNPQLRAQQARIDAADRGRDLADRNWYPDIGVGVGVNQTDRGLDSYQAMVEVNLPLQWGLRRAQQAEATAMASGARQRLAQMDRQLEGDLAEAVQGLASARELERLIDSGLVPQAEAGLQAALKGYESGLSEFTAVLEAERRLQKVHIDHLKVQLDQQMRLAEIERLIGEDL